MADSSAPTNDAFDVAHLAKLARLLLPAAEQSQARADLANIIHMVDQMASIDTDGIEPMAHPLDAAARLRPDAVTETVDRSHFQAGAPSTEDGYYLVPRVVE